MGLLGRAAHRIAVAEPHAVPLVDEIQMRVDLHHVDRPVIREGGDAGDVDRVVAAEHDRQRAGFEDRANAVRDVGVAGGRIGVDDVGVADVDDPDFRSEVGGVILVVVGAAMAEREQGRGLADRPRTEPGARPPLRFRNRTGPRGSRRRRRSRPSPAT